MHCEPLELKAVDLWWVNANANVRKECLVVGAPRVDAVLGIVERVEARVDSVVTVILIFIEERVTCDDFD